MPPEVLDRVSVPFFTTKEIGKDSGPGLPQVYGFTQQSDGKLTIPARSERAPSSPCNCVDRCSCPLRQGIRAVPGNSTSMRVAGRYF